MNYTNYFIYTGKKGNFVLSIEAPEDLKGLINKIHGDYFGDTWNEWTIGQIYNAFVDLNLKSYEEIEYLADVYTANLIEWLQIDGALDFCSTYLNDYRDVETWDIIDYLQGGQCLAKEAIYREVEYFLTDNKKG